MDRVLVDQIATLYPEHSWLAESWLEFCVPLGGVPMNTSWRGTEF